MKFSPDPTPNRSVTSSIVVCIIMREGGGGNKNSCFRHHFTLFVFGLVETKKLKSGFREHKPLYKYEIIFKNENNIIS